jgi:hypothetical protein
MAVKIANQDVHDTGFRCSCLFQSPQTFSWHEHVKTARDGLEDFRPVQWFRLTDRVCEAGPFVEVEAAHPAGLDDTQPDTNVSRNGAQRADSGNPDHANGVESQAIQLSWQFSAAD